MVEYNTQIHGVVSWDYKEKWEIIKKENPETTLRHIFETFIDEYLSTTPHGTHIKIKEIEKQINENKEKIDELYERNNKLKIELKACEESLNNTELNEGMPDDDPNLMKATESVMNVINSNGYETYDDIPLQTFIQISKYNKIKTEELQEKIRTQF